MMPTLVSLAAGDAAGIPMTLSIFASALFVLYLVGALLVTETRGRFE